MQNLKHSVRFISAVALLALVSGCNLHFRDRRGQDDVQIVQNGDHVDIVARSDDGHHSGGLTIHASDGGPAHIQGMIHIDGQSDIRLDGILGQDRVQKEVEQRFASDQVEQLQVKAGSGRIDVRSTDGDHDEIQIRAMKTLSGNLPQDRLRPLLARVVVTAVLQGRTLVLQSQYAPGALPAGVSSSVDYSILVPKRLSAELTTGSGDVNVDSIEGGLNVQTDSGDVTLKEVGGRIQAHVASGGVHMEGGRIADSLDISAASGDIELSGVAAVGSSLSVKLSSASGSIHYEGDASRLAVNSASGDIELMPTSRIPLGDSEVTSVSGGIELTVPSSCSVRISARSASGTLDLPHKSLSEDDDPHHATAQIGSGAAELKLKTASGDIAVQTR